MKTILLIFACLLSLATIAQEPVISPTPGNYTVCPRELIVYEIQPGNFSGCGNYTWTISNGSFSFTSTITSTTTTTNEVDVFWSDVAGNGTLTVTSSCSEGTLSVSKTYAIRSLAGRVPQNIRKHPNLNLCETTSVRVFVDVMFLENTGGNTNIQPQQRADGYEWAMPAGWTHNGSATTPVRTVEEFIDITPIDGCKGGSITVKAFKNCTSGRKYSASSASLSLNRPIGTILRVPTGYTGPKCGDINPVVFTATNVSCATNYRWTATGTQWKDAQGALGPWNTASNTITLFPTGTNADDGNIAVDIMLPCGTFTQTFRALYSNPNLPSPTYTSNSPQLLCTNSSGTVTVNAVTGAASYSWYTTGGTAYINGIQTTPSNPITTSTTNITLSSPTLTGTGYLISVHVNANRATAGCAGSNTIVRGVWFGLPANVETIAQGLQNPPPFYVCPNTLYQFNAFDFTNITNVTTFSWYTYGNHTISSYNGTGNITANITTGYNVDH